MISEQDAEELTNGSLPRTSETGATCRLDPMISRRLRIEEGKSAEMTPEPS